MLRGDLAEVLRIQLLEERMDSGLVPLLYERVQGSQISWSWGELI